MRLCNEALYTLILSIIILIGDVYLFGVGISTLVHLLIGLTFVIATNSVCHNPNFKWYIGLVVFSHVIISASLWFKEKKYRQTSKLFPNH